MFFRLILSGHTTADFNGRKAGDVEVETPMNQDEFEKAVKLLEKELSPKLIAELSCLNIDKIEQDPGVGLMVRNILRRGGIEWIHVKKGGEWYNIMKAVMEGEGD